MAETYSTAFREFVRGKQTVAIICKGKLDKPIPDNYDLYIGIKQSIVIAPKKDVFVTAHFEGIFGTEAVLPEISFIVAPSRILKGPRENRHWCDTNELKSYARFHGFTGQFVIVPAARFNNSAWVAFHFLRGIGFRHPVDTYGYYNCTIDNPEITSAVVNANVPDKYRPCFDALMQHNYKKREQNVLGNWKCATALAGARNMKKRVKIRKQINKLRRETAHQFPSLTIRYQSQIQLE